jgi:hypothetical protein
MEAGRRRTADNRASRELLARQWKRFGVDLPAENIQAEMDYCAHVSHRPPGVAADAGLMDVLAGIYELDRGFAPLSGQFETHYHSDFSFLLAGMLLGDRKAVLGKFAVIKDLARRQPMGRLEALLDQARPERLFADLRA